MQAAYLVHAAVGLARLQDVHGVVLQVVPDDHLADSDVLDAGVGHLLCVVPEPAQHLPEQCKSQLKHVHILAVSTPAAQHGLATALKQLARACYSCQAGWSLPAAGYFLNTISTPR